MKGLARRFFLGFMLAAVMGGQWAMMQSVAWTSMLVSHLRTDSLPAAMALTFDGAHPCPLCNAIAQGKQSEKKSEIAPKVARLEFLIGELSDKFCEPLQGDLLAIDPDDFANSFDPTPLTPPPRPNCA